MCPGIKFKDQPDFTGLHLLLTSINIRSHFSDILNLPNDLSSLCLRCLRRHCNSGPRSTCGSLGIYPLTNNSASILSEFVYYIDIADVMLEEHTNTQSTYGAPLIIYPAGMSRRNFVKEWGIPGLTDRKMF